MVRFGYACINTVLRSQNIFTNRTLRLATLREKGLDYAKELALKNVKDLLPILKWNETHNIRFFRVSSEIFPFASDAEFGYSVKFAEKELKEVGDFAKKFGHRITFHPGHFNVICSPTEKVFENTCRDLQHHTEILELMGMGPDSVLVIHMGGAYGDKKTSLERFETNFLRLPLNVRNRLVLENDEVVYNIEELLPVCIKLSIPLVVDWHHDHLNPSTKQVQEYLPVINKIWSDRGITPKQHYSESAPGHPNKRAHSDYIKQLPPCSGSMHLMIEAKMKEQTILKLNEWYGVSLDSQTYPPDFDVDKIPEKDLHLFDQVEMEGKGRKKLQWKNPEKKKTEKTETQEESTIKGKGKGKGKEKVKIEQEQEEAEVEKKISKGKGKGRMAVETETKKEVIEKRASSIGEDKGDKLTLSLPLTNEHAPSTNVLKRKLEEEEKVEAKTVKGKNSVKNGRKKIGDI